MEFIVNEVFCKVIIFVGFFFIYILSDYVFIVCIVSGKYVKLKVKSFYDDEGKSGIYLFEYVI